MAKKRVEKVDAVAVGLEDERSGAEAAGATIDERVSAVMASHPEPVDTLEVKAEGSADVAAAGPSAAAVWHVEAEEILTLVRSGNAVSPSRVVACLTLAVGLVPTA